MWYGNATQNMKDEAERISKKLEIERRQERIARWVASAAFARVQAQLKLEKQINKEKSF